MNNTITIRLDKTLARKLDYAAKKNATTRSMIVREAVGTYLAEPPPKKAKAKTLWEVAGHLAGTVKGGPRDLSYNPKHMEGFGQ